MESRDREHYNYIWKSDRKNVSNKGSAAVAYDN